MDGLPGLAEAFVSAFPAAVVARCWVHKVRNVMTRVPRRYHAAIKPALDAIMHAPSREAAEHAWTAMEAGWTTRCKDAVSCLAKDKQAPLAHDDFPQDHWVALKTTNPIERVNRECKRRLKAMDTVGPRGLKVLLAFTALRLEANWHAASITNPKLANLRNQRRTTNTTVDAAKELLN